jgi:LysM domain-containing protein
MSMRAALLVSLLVPLALARTSAAQPAAAPDPGLTPPSNGGNDNGAGSMGARRSSALDAAFGTPPADGRVDPTTTNDPDYASRKGGGAADQTYGSTARSYGADGQLVEGYQINGYDDPEGDYDEPVPDVHVVQEGDTLWDISGYYLGDPYSWPRLWSYNEHITNAHWIFPGDRVRLYDPRRGPRRGGGGDGGDEGPNLRFSKTRVPEGAEEDSYLLNQTAYVDAAEFETAMRITGGADANVLMSTLDTVYMSYDRKHPPVRGERLVVYAPQRKVRDLKDKKVLGYIVQIMGDVEVESIARKMAEGTVVNAINPIERGYRVGPLRRQFKRVDEVESDESAGGIVVATLNDAGPMTVRKSSKARYSLLADHVLVGETQFVVVNLGSTDGIDVGNTLEVVRKGDEYVSKRTKKRDKIPYEDGWPRRVIGSLIVLQTQPETALCATVYARHEIERGDHVELRGRDLAGQQVLDDEGGGRRRRRDAGAKGTAEAKDGKVRMGGEMSY